MKEVEIEALMTFKYSPDGARIRIVEKGLEFSVKKALADKLTAGNPPRARVIGDVVEPTPIVEEKEILEEVEVVEDVIDDENVEIDLSIEEDVQINGQEVEIGEEVEELDGEYENMPAYKTVVELDELEKLIKDSKKGADEVELGPKFIALRKGGAWYNVYNKVTDEVENETGMKLNAKMAKYVYELYLSK